MRIARGLFAERGLRNVTVREIALAAGQRNMGVVGYYFGTKENLIAEILIEGAQEIEARRRTYLERMELGDGPRSVLEVIEAMVRPSVEYAEEATENTFNRFLMQVSLSDEGFIDRTLGGRWNSGYQRCLRLLRGFMAGLSTAEQNRRFVFLGTYLGGLLALRENMIADPTRAHATWRADATLDDILITAAALIAAPAGRP
ncbi:MAG: helix-turn-helix transcriptional regulator [Alphaproteobacteria bacterium]|nr:helix-turn-helix transcriptional regulator [Alphaproteobacteria bacterium]